MRTETKTTESGTAEPKASEINLISPPGSVDFVSSPPRPCKSSLHVLTITPFFPFDSNPVYGTYISEPIQLFAEHNLRSTVTAVSPLHHERRRPLPGAKVQWLRYPQIPGNFGLASAGTFLYRRLLGHITRLHHARPIDVIHAHSALPCGHAALLLSESLHIPFVVTVHGLDVFNACFELETAAAKRRAKLSADVYRRAASVICISRSIENRLKAGIQQPVSSCVIYNGTDPRIFSPEENINPHGIPTILIVGNLLRGKGHEVVLKAMAQLASQFPTVQCKIVGEGPDQNRFAAYARDLGISGRAIFMGLQNREAVAQIMRECTIFALPSRFEGLGCAYLEAMACGKPVIACEGQGIGEIIRHRDNGWLIPIDGVPQMADALTQLLTSPDLRVRIGGNARDTIVHGLTMADQVHHFDHLYRDVTRRQAL